MKRVTCLLLIVSILVAGCAGRNANCVQLYVPGDENMSVDALKAEIVLLESEMNRILPETNKFGYNAVMATAGCVLIVPFFFMDMKDAEKAEWNAMRLRRNRLVALAVQKGATWDCGTPQMIPSLEELKKKKPTPTK